MNRKAQGALEFLTTYGWAFLVILIMIGAMMYFGILNPDKFLPERCTTNTGFSCEEQNIVADSSETKITFVIKNNLPQTIKLGSTGTLATSDISLNGDLLSGSAKVHPNALGPIGSGNNITCNATSTIIQQNEATTISCIVNGNARMGDAKPLEGSKSKIVIDVKYVPVGKTYSQVLSTEIFGKIQ